MLKMLLWKGLVLAKRIALRTICTIGNFAFRLERPLDEKAIRKILIIHADNASVGDTLLCSAILEPIRKRFPKARISFLAREPSEAILKHNPNIDELIVYSKERGANLATSQLIPLFYAKEFKREHGSYDLIITTEHALRFIIFSFLLGAKQRVGVDTEGRGFLLTKKVKAPYASKRSKHELEYYLDIARAVGAEIDEPEKYFKVYTGKDEEKEAERILGKNGIAKNAFMVGIHPGAGLKKNRWKKERFAEVCTELCREYGTKIIIFGGRGETELAEETKKLIDGKAVVATGIGVLVAAALLKRCKLVIANDSGISHLAAAAKTRVLTLFGSDNPVRWAPYGKGNGFIKKEIPGYAKSGMAEPEMRYAFDNENEDDPDVASLDAIKMQEVLTAAKRVLGRK